MKTPPKAFITYSHKNAQKRKDFQESLAVMVQNKEIEIWCDAEIPAGDEWEGKIIEKLETADVLLYLVSTASLASPNCNRELTKVLSKKPNIKIIPIILEDCDFENHSLAKFEALPTKNKDITPISDWRPQRKGWKNVVKGIRGNFSKKPESSTHETPQQPQTNIPTPEEVESFPPFERANFFLTLHSYETALLGYTMAIEQDPKHAAAYTNRGNLHNRKDEDDKALADFNKAIAINPELAEAYNNRGNVYLKQAKYNKSIADFNKAIAIRPDNPEAYYNRGLAYEKEEEYDSAINDYSQTIKLKPNLAIAYNNRGGIYTQKSEYDNALADFNKAIKLNKNYANAYYNRGVVYQNKGEYDNAINDYNKTIELDSNYMEAYYNRGNAYSKKGEYDRAIDNYNKSIERNPNIPEIYNNRGIAYVILQNYKAAKKDFQTALRLAKQQGNTEFAEEIQKGIEALPRQSQS